jgi:hypothetical protein
VAARPVEHAPDERLAEPRVAAEAGGEGARLRLVEVRQLDPLPDVEGRGARVLDEVGGRGDAEQAERQAAQLRVFRAPVVELAQRREELVGREREAPDGVDLVHEEDDVAPDLLQHDLAHGARPTLQGREPLVVTPEVFQLVFEVELLADAAEQAVVPLLGREVLADGRQVEDGDGRARLAQARGRAHHQGRLAHLPRGEHVAEAPLAQAPVQLLVGAPRHVGRGVAPQRPACDVEAGGLGRAHSRSGAYGVRGGGASGSPRRGGSAAPARPACRPTSPRRCAAGRTPRSSGTGGPRGRRA